MIIDSKCILILNEEVEMYRNLGLENRVSPNEIVVDLSFELEDVSVLRRDTDKEGNIDTTTCVIYMRSGDRFVIKDSYDRLRQLKDKLK